MGWGLRVSSLAEVSLIPGWMVEAVDRGDGNLT